jgi:tetratricopeptide (TPR) repeat protein
MENEDLAAAAGGIPLFVRAAIDAGDTARVTSFAATIARAVLRSAAARDAKKSGSVDRATALQVADLLLAAGEETAAQPILAALDSTRDLRGPDVLLRMVAYDVLRGAVDDARATLERARAFDTKGASDFETLLLSGAADKDADLAALASAVEDAGYVRNLLARAQNLIVQKRTSEARAILDEELAGAHPRDPWWNLTAAAAALQAPHAGPPVLSPWLGEDAGREAERFLTGSGYVDAAGKPDPRRALLFVWAARNPQGAMFTRAWLELVDPQKQGDLWPEWMLASLEATQGFETLALQRLQRLIARHPGFGPAWELQEQLLDHAERSDEERAQFERLRDAALGSSDGTQSAKLAAKARASRDAGARDEAIDFARQALDADAWSLDARILLARLQEQAGRDEAALATLQAGTSLEAPEDGRPWPPPPSDADGDRFVREYLELIVRLLGVPQGPLTRARGEALLKSLAKERPDDPRVVLAQAELDLDADERSPSMGVARAFSRLELFRAAHKNVPLDDLGEGSIAGWTAFYARLDPLKAQAFVENELSLDPTRLTTWLEVVHVDEAGGDSARALKKLELFARLAPRGDVLREILRLRSQGDMTPEAIEESARAIVLAEGKSGPDAELVLLQARCYLNLGPRMLGKVFELMQGLEAWRDVSHSFHVQSAVLSATAWMSRGTPEDLKRTREVLEDVKDEGDVYQRAYVRVLLELAKSP